MNKKHLLLICMAFLFCLNPLCAQLPSYSGGSGTAGDPFLIRTSQDLINLSTAVNKNSSYSGTTTGQKYFKLDADIDMTGVSFTPIGKSSSFSFKGQFDGAGHTISNLNITGTTSYLGFFGYIKGSSATCKAIVKNLNLVNCSVSCTKAVQYTGGLCAHANTNSEIRNVTFQGTVYSAGSYVGMICGDAYSATIDCCVTSGIVTTNGQYGGGICGRLYNNTVSHCCNLATVNGTGKYLGGICGYMYSYTKNAYINYCSNFGNVEGNLDGNELISGGIVGCTYNYSYTYMEKCYNVGSACGEAAIGAIIGSGTGSPASHCSDLYYDSNVCNNIDYSGTCNPIGKTTAELTNGTVFNNAANWSEAPGRYPIPAGLENNALVLAAATAVPETPSIPDVPSIPEVWDDPDANIEINGNFVLGEGEGGSLTGSGEPGEPGEPTTYFVHDLEIISGSQLTISSTAVLVVGGNLHCDDASQLVLEDGAQLFHTAADVQATIKKNIEGYSNEEDEDGWYFISAPILDNPNTSAVQPTSGDYDLYRYNTASGKWENVKNSEHADFTTLNDGQGFLYANSSGEPLSFAGTLSAEHQDIALSHEGNGWNLIGNPFPCNATVNVDYFYCTGSSVESRNHTVPVAPGMGIMVQATDNIQSVTFTKALPGEQSMQPVPEILAEVSKAARGAKLMDNARINFGESQLEKFYFNGNSCLYIPQGDKEYAMVSAENESTMPLCFVAPKNDNYTIRFNIENVDLEYFHLIDNMTGNDVDLLANDSYTFSAKTSDYASRFKLVFRAENEESQDEGNEESFCYFANGQLFVPENTENAMLTVTDMSGRVVLQETVSGSYGKTIEAAPGIYVVTLGDRSQKIVIR